MVCSICGTSGHNKATCSKNDVKTKQIVCDPINKTRPVPSEEVTNVPVMGSGDVMCDKKNEVNITLPDDVCEKLTVMGDIAKRVANILGKGYVEGVYQQAIGVELQKRNIGYGMEEPMPIIYDGVVIGLHTQRLDIIIHKYLPIIFELKAKQGVVTCTELWQLIHYMKNKNYPYGVIVNYNQSFTGDLQIIFIISYEGTMYVYDNVTKKGEKMKDYSYTEK
jgi:GxxExxY protein